MLVGEKITRESLRCLNDWGEASTDLVTTWKDVSICNERTKSEEIKICLSFKCSKIAVHQKPVTITTMRSMEEKLPWPIQNYRLTTEAIEWRKMAAMTHPRRRTRAENGGKLSSISLVPDRSRPSNSGSHPFTSAPGLQRGVRPKLINYTGFTNTRSRRLGGDSCPLCSLFNVFYITLALSVTAEQQNPDICLPISLCHLHKIDTESLYEKGEDIKHTKRNKISEVFLSVQIFLKQKLQLKLLDNRGTIALLLTTTYVRTQLDVLYVARDGPSTDTCSRLIKQSRTLPAPITGLASKLNPGLASVLGPCWNYDSPLSSASRPRPTPFISDDGAAQDDHSAVSVFAKVQQSASVLYLGDRIIRGILTPQRPKGGRV
ncbi:hypothetical protein J6590_004307 [Homalodisca vitripennis]|nr:hypothetical protein J6590_004307 [Homalodisca vitripennis]